MIRSGTAPSKAVALVSGPISGRETILAIAADAASPARLQQELQGSGYSVLTAVGSQQALKALSRQPVELIVVMVHSEGRIADRRSSRPAAKSPAHPGSPTEKREQEGYALARIIKSAPQAARIPVLLIVSVWAEAVLTRGLESGADAFLFTPYQDQDLLRAIRDALLNGPLEEPSEVLPEIEIVHQDRRHAVKAGRSQLARLSFSVLEELRQSRAALAWSQAETQELQQQVRIQQQQSHLALLVPEVVEGIAHDFSNLLETVSAAVTVLRSSPANPEPYHDAMETALAQAGMLVTTLQNCTQWEQEGAQLEAVDLAVVVEEVIEAALLPLRAPNVRVRTRVQGLPLISSNLSLIFRSVSNLVWNAIQAMPAGGMLSILGYVQRNRVVLEITDTGTGIAEKDQEQIFSPHFSTKQGHAGVGLFLARRLVRRAGGEIIFASRPGRGSVFALSFAVAPAEETVVQPPGHANHGIASG
jgi:signal transduction histidine kinase